MSIELLGASRSENYSHYEFPKVQEVFSIVRSILMELRFPQHVWNSFGRPEDNLSKGAEDSIKDYTDRRYEFEQKGIRIVVIFGNKKVFFLAYSDKVTQKKILKTLNNFIKD